MSMQSRTRLGNRYVQASQPRSHRHGKAPTAAAALALMSLLLPCLAFAQGTPSSITTSGDIESAGKLVSTTSAGPPLQVSSTAQVPNLNADLLDGLHAGSFALSADLADLENLVATQQDTIDAQQQLIARLHPKLVLHNSRFRAWVTFVDDGVQQPAEAVPVGMADLEGFFYFTRDFYVDVYVKVLDARPVSNRWWVFFAPLTDLEYTVNVLDTETGSLKSYPSPEGSRTSIFDTNAFFDSGGFPVKAPRGPEPSGLRQASASLASCVSDAETLCLVSDRFQIRATFSTGPPASDAQVSGLVATSHSGAFGFFDTGNTDILVKVVEKPAAFEVNIGTLTNVQFTVTVTDTCTGTTEDYVNPLGSSTNFGDTTTFPNTPC
jgi:hypothetical protein